MPARSIADICNMALLYAGVNKKIGSLTQVNSAEAQACNTIYDEHRRNMISAFRWPFTVKRGQLVPYFGATYDANTVYAAGALATYGVNVYRSLLAGNAGHTPSDNASAAWWFQVTRDGYAFACPLPDDCLDPIEAWEKPTVSAFATPQIYNFRDPSDFNLRNPRSSQRAPFKLENANDGTDLEILLTDIDTPILKYTADVQNPEAFPTEFVEALAWDLAGPLARGLRGDEKKGDSCDRRAKEKMAEAFVVSMRDQQEDQEPVSEFEAARNGSM